MKKHTIKNYLLLGGLLVFASYLVGCGSENQETEVDESIFIVAGTSSDRYEPWLALRDSNAYCSNIVGRLQDGTRLRIINESSSDDLVEVELISYKGFVSKKFLEQLPKENKSDTNAMLTTYVLDILTSFKTQDYSNIVNYIHPVENIRFFYFDVSKCDFNPAEVKKLHYRFGANSEDSYEYSPYSKFTGRMAIKEILKYNKSNTSYCSFSCMPAAGFGGGSVRGVDDDSYVVSISLDPNDLNSDELWFIFKKYGKEMRLVEIGDWAWSP